MRKVDLSQAQANFSKLLNRVEKKGDRIVIEQEGRTVAAL